MSSSLPASPDLSAPPAPAPAPTSAPSRRGRLLEFGGGLVLQLAVTLLLLGLGWLRPGRGREAGTLRGLGATWLPALVLLLIYPALVRRGRRAFLTGLLCGLLLVGLALIGGAIGVGVAFRV